MNILTVPVRIEAFVSTGNDTVVTTAEHFSLLPYVNQNHTDVNASVANLPSSIERSAFDGKEYLPEGVHLHFRLPKALTKGTMNQEGIDMPFAPNRWLVRRVHHLGTEPTKEWIVESDYLYPQGVVPERAISIPALENGNPHQQPWEYLGRQLLREEWENESLVAQHSHRYLPKLTTLGWGSPYFANLYGDCCSVFGFYDNEVNQSSVTSYRYEVFAWYSNPEHDFATTRLNQARYAGQTQVEQAQEQASWVVDDTQAGLESVSACICYGKVVFDSNADFSLPEHRFAQTPSVSLAKTPAEAAAVFLSKQQAKATHASSEEAVKLENQILALLYTDSLHGTNVDQINQLKVARHKDEFSAIEAGKLWVTVNEVTATENIADEELKQRVRDAISEVRQTLAKGLTRLNKMQEALNQSQQRCAYYRRNLYNDWSKYMMSAYSSEKDFSASPSAWDASGASAAALTPDEIRLYMTTYSIPALQAEMERSEELLQQVAAQAAQFEDDYATWKTPFLQEGANLPEKLLELKSGSQYWKANDPYVFLSGDVLVDKGEEANGLADVNTQASSQGLSQGLSCNLYASHLPTAQAWLFNQVDADTWYWQQHSINHWASTPWSPLFIEWEVNLFPDETARNHFEARDSHYMADFIHRNYRIPLNDNQFGLPSASVDLHLVNQHAYQLDDRAVEVQGRALVSDGIQKVLNERITQFVEKQQERTQETGDIHPMVASMQSVSQLLATQPCALISLSGLNDQLMMYSDTTLLNIHDPFCLKKQATPHVSEQVRALLNGHQLKLPAIHQRFMPIKSGITKLAMLRVVDRFGQTVHLDCRDVLRPSREVVGNAVYAPPRVMQPLRLSFEWVDKQKEKALTPIQGWLGYNTFDETLNLFDDDGSHLGLLNSDGEWCNERGLIQTLDSTLYRPLREYVLKLQSFHANNRIIKSLFIDALLNSGSSMASNAEAEATWQALIQAGALRPLSDQKALCVTLTRADWAAQVAPKTGLSFDDSRTLFIASRASNNYWPKLKQAIRDGVENIEPLGSVSQASLGVIKPLAIVLAELDLQVLGGPEMDKSHEAMKLDLSRFPRTNRHYTDVKFPIKLGEFNNLDDGLVAYWQVYDGYQLLGDGYFPQSFMDDIRGYIDAASFDPNTDDFIDKIRERGVANLSQSISDAPIRLLLLMDPESNVHATCGVVPKNALRLPDDAYDNALKKMQSRYFIAPYLTPSDAMTLTLPGDTEWMWQYPTGQTQAGVARYANMLSVALLDKTRFLDAGASTDDWAWLQQNAFINVLQADENLAQFVPLNDTESLDSATQAKLNQLLTSIQYATQPSFAEPVNKAIPKQVSIVEGWLSPSAISVS